MLSFHCSRSWKAQHASREVQNWFFQGIWTHLLRHMPLMAHHPLGCNPKAHGTPLFRLQSHTEGVHQRHVFVLVLKLPILCSLRPTKHMSWLYLGNLFDGRGVAVIEGALDIEPGAVQQGDAVRQEHGDAATEL